MSILDNGLLSQQVKFEHKGKNRREDSLKQQRYFLFMFAVRGWWRGEILSLNMTLIHWLLQMLHLLTFWIVIPVWFDQWINQQSSGPEVPLLNELGDGRWEELAPSWRRLAERVVRPSQAGRVSSLWQISSQAGLVSKIMTWQIINKHSRVISKAKLMNSFMFLLSADSRKYFIVDI